MNDAPVSVSDTYSIDFNTVLTADVRDNDLDVDGDDLVVVPQILPQNGTLFIQPDGQFTYTPFFGYSGGDIFTYILDDGNDTSEVRNCHCYGCSEAGEDVDLLAHFQLDDELDPATDSSGNGHTGFN